MFGKALQTIKIFQSFISLHFTQRAELEGWFADQQQQVVHEKTLGKAQRHFFVITVFATDGFVLCYQLLSHSENDKNIMHSLQQKRNVSKGE